MSRKKKRRQKPRRPVRKLAAPKTADLDVVVPVYGQPELLTRCLASIYETNNLGILSVRIILVDDASPDQEAMQAVYGNLNGDCTLLRNKENLGFPRTVNRGVQQGCSPLVLILNSDVELQTGCLEVMLSEFGSNPAVGVVGPKLLFAPESVDPKRPAGTVQHAGLAVNFKGRVIHANIGWSADHPKVNQRRVMQAVTGACLMTRRELWNRVTHMYRQSGMPASGGFCDVYGRGTYEDVEYCLAVRGQGNSQTIYQPVAVATHQVGASIRAADGFPLNRNEMIFRARCGHILAWDEWRFH